MDQSNRLDARDWCPQVGAGPAPYYLRLADALQDAVHAHRLPEGARLPTQRELAERLRVSVGTANSAYLEAERRGLIRRHVGRGTFVAAPGDAGARGGRINLAINQPPLHVVAPMLRRLLVQLINDAEGADLLGYPAGPGHGRYARAVAQWITRIGRMPPLGPDAILPCHGATQGLLAVLKVIARPGDRLLCEAVTYSGFKAAAEHLQLELVPVPLDGEGMSPDALEEAAARHRATAVLVCPTLQNPTGTTASPERREQWLRAARRHDLLVIEDDVYGALAEAPGSSPALAALDPERVFHVSGSSKAMAPGLRAGWVIPPARHREAVRRELAAQSTWGPPHGSTMLATAPVPFGHLAFAKACETRLADEILAQVRREMRLRQDLARRVLGDAMQADAPACNLHVWLPLSSRQAESLHQALAVQNIHATPPGAPMVDGVPVGLRLCLGAPERIEALDEALHVVRGEIERMRSEGAGWHP